MLWARKRVLLSALDSKHCQGCVTYIPSNRERRASWYLLIKTGESDRVSTWIVANWFLFASRSQSREGCSGNDRCREVHLVRLGSRL